MKTIKINTTITAYELHELRQGLQEEILSKTTEDLFNNGYNYATFYKADAKDEERAKEYIKRENIFFDIEGNELIIKESKDKITINDIICSLEDHAQPSN